MTPRAPCLAAAAGACALVLVLGALACAEGPTEPACDGGPSAGTLTLWTACSVQSLSQPSVELTLTNDSSAPVWFYRDCDPGVPWPTQLQQDGTWRRLLPPTFLLTTGCAAVQRLDPGESQALAMSMQPTEGPGTYRAEMMVAWDCAVDPEPLHVPHECQRVEFLLTEPFELR